MKAIFAQLTAVALAVSGAYAQTLTVNTPSGAVVCQPLLISWTGGTPPYFLPTRPPIFFSILPGNQPGAAALVDFGSVGTATSRTWTVTEPANTALGITLRDSTGTVAQTAAFTVNPGADTSCLNSTSTITPSIPASTSSGTAPSTTVSTPATSSHSTTAPPNTASTSSRSQGTTTTSSTAAPANGATGKFAQIGMSVVLGAAAVALMA